MQEATNLQADLKAQSSSLRARMDKEFKVVKDQFTEDLEKRNYYGRAKGDGEEVLKKIKDAIASMTPDPFTEEGKPPKDTGSVQLEDATQTVAEAGAELEARVKDLTKRVKKAFGAATGLSKAERAAALREFDAG